MKVLFETQLMSDNSIVTGIKCTQYICLEGFLLSRVLGLMRALTHTNISEAGSSKEKKKEEKLPGESRSCTQEEAIDQGDCQYKWLTWTALLDCAKKSFSKWSVIGRTEIQLNLFLTS